MKFAFLFFLPVFISQLGSRLPVVKTKSLLSLLCFHLYPQQVNELYPTYRELVCPTPLSLSPAFLFPSLVVWECKGRNIFLLCKTFLKYFFIPQKPLSFVPF